MISFMDKIKIAQIGCGYWGPNLLRNFHQLPNAEVVMVAEASADRRKFVERGFPGVRTVATAGEVFASPEIQAVVIATPAFTHHAMAMAALRAGKHVFVEKPLSTNVADAEEILSYGSKHGLTVMAGHTFLYNPAVRRLKEIVESGELGELYYIYSQRLNLGQLRSDVNAWWNLAPHDVSILVYLLNATSACQVTATGMDYIQPGVEDVVFATMKWSSGAVGQVHVSWLDPGKVRKMTLVGSRKMIVYDDMADNKLTIFDKGFDKIPRLGDQMSFDQTGRPDVKMRSGDIHMPFINGEEPLKAEAKHFVECIQTGAAPLSGGDHALQVVALLEAGERSLKERRSVEYLPKL